MRQLVSVVSEGSLRYFIHDGDEVMQVAQLVDPGVDVGSVIEIGVSLGSLYEKLPVNGLVNGKPAVKAGKAPKVEPEALPAPPPEPKVPFIRTDLTTEEIIAYITKHPGVRSTMIAADLLPGKRRPGQTAPRQTVDNRLRSLVAKHEAAGTEAPVHKRLLGPMHVAWYPGPAAIEHDEVGEGDDGHDVSDAPVTEG